jgi:hypothetical protein
MVWCLKSPNNGAEVALKSPFVPLFSKGESYEDGKQREPKLSTSSLEKDKFCVPLFGKEGPGEI